MKKPTSGFLAIAFVLIIGLLALGPMEQTTSWARVNLPPVVDSELSPDVGESEIGNPSYSFTVTYSDDSEIDVSTIDTNDVFVAGTAITLPVVSASTSSGVNTTPATATYTVTPPGGTWDAADNDTYTIILNGSEIGDDGSPQLFVAADLSLGTFEVNATNTAPVVNSVIANDLTAANLGETSYSFSVEYSDVGGIDVSTIDASDVTVTGPGGSLTVTGASEPTGTDGSPRTATYTVAPPGGDWDAGDAGAYFIRLLDSQVFDTNGAAVPGADPLASFEVLLNLDQVQLVGGVLRITGTDEADRVQINRAGSDLKVHTDFTANSLLVFPLSDISQIVMYLGAGDDHVTVSGHVELPSLIHAGAGDDKVKGGAGPSVLLGESGDDSLNGGNSNDILIGGEDRDRTVGQNGDDILIAGTTIYDADDAALIALMQEWNSGDDYPTRVSNLRTGSGSLGGIVLEKDSTVFDDGDRDRLTGSSDRDWFFFGPGEDLVNDKKSSEEGN